MIDISKYANQLRRKHILQIEGTLKKVIELKMGLTAIYTSGQREVHFPEREQVELKISYEFKEV